MSRSLSVLALVASLASTAAIHAQRPAGGDPASPGPSTTSVDPTMGAELAFLVPRGEFGEREGLSIGYGVRGAVALARRVLDVGAVFRSIARDRSTDGETTVAQMMRTLALEARVTSPLPWVRPYVAGSVGGAYFGTEISEYQCCDDDGEWHDALEDIRASSITPIAAVRFGFVLELTPSGTGQPVISIDAGMERHVGGRATFEVGNELVTTRTNARVYSVGISIRDGRRRQAPAQAKHSPRAPRE